MQSKVKEDIILFEKIRVKRLPKLAKRDDWKRERKALRQKKSRVQEYHMQTHGR